jgi:predicted  nucleic acid-binding Zn-ribbon protein
MALQGVDRRLQELQDSLATTAGRVEQLREETQKNQAELDRLSDEEKESAAARKKLERELAEGEARIRNKRMRLNLVRNDKELQALTHEVESLKENNQRVESDLLAMMEGVDPRVGRIKELGGIVEKLKSELTAAEKEIAAQVEELKSSIAKARREREQMTAEMDRVLLRRYEMIFSRRNGLAVAEARGGTCMGCRRLLPPQLYNEIQKKHEIHYCPNCQRILYYEG